MPARTTEPSIEQRLKALEDLVAGRAAEGRAATPDPTAPLWMQNVAYPAQTDRQLLSAVWPERQGIVRVNDLQVTQRGAGANLSVDVSPGSCLVQGSDAPDQGSYLQTFAAITNVPLAPAPPAGQQRRDLIVVQAQDDGVLGTISGPRGQIRAVTGPASSTSPPPLPAQPPSSYVLAIVGPITASTAQVTNSMITDQRTAVAPQPWRAHAETTSGTELGPIAVPTGAEFPYIHIRGRVAANQNSSLYLRFNESTDPLYWGCSWYQGGFGPYTASPSVYFGGVPWGPPNSAAFDAAIWRDFHSPTNTRVIISGSGFVWENMNPYVIMFGATSTGTDDVNSVSFYVWPGAFSAAQIDLWQEP